MMRDEEYEAGLSPETFREIFNERRTERREKAKLKRLNDFQRIQDMNSTEGKTAVELLPEEIWESIILDDLSPQDRRNVWQLDPLFRALMETTHLQENLFPLILKFLQGYLFQTVKLVDDDAEANNEDTELLNRPYLQLRRVCKSFRDAVDRVIEDDLLLRLREDERIVMNLQLGREPKKVTKFQFFCFQHDLDQDILRLERILSFTESNSQLLKCFVSRSLYIDLYLLSEMEFEIIFPEVRSRVSRLLRYAGDKILFFNVRITQCQETMDNRLTLLYSTLVEWLTFLPNLKWLHIHFLCGEKRLGNAFDFQVIRNQPPPVLECLERLDFSVALMTPCQGEEMEAICRALVTACPKVTRLNLVCSGVYDALTSVGPETFYLGTAPNPFLDLTPIASTLKCLTLRLDLSHDVHNMSSVLQFIQQFPSLEVLNLEIENVVIDDGLDFLQLPNLKDLEMRFRPIFNGDAPFQFFFSLNFLMHCGKLRKLFWNNRLQIEGVRELMEYLELPEDPGTTIDFVDGRRLLTDSNVWDVFPYLEKVVTVIIVPFGDGGHNILYREHRNRKLIQKSDMASDKDGNPVPVYD